MQRTNPPICPLGGWETCLEATTDENITCVICYDVMIRPRTACKNGHSACEECLDLHLDSPAGGKCPGGCGEAITRSTLRQLSDVEKKICQLPAKCKYARSQVKDGEEHCAWTGVFGDLLEHLQTDCDFEHVECPYAKLGCTELVRRRDHEMHLRKATLRHMELHVTSVATLNSTVASLSAQVQALQERMELARMRAPPLLELELNPAMTTASLPDETQAFLGLYKLDESKLINGRPMWLHCEDARRCIAFNHEHGFWHAQRRNEAGEARGFIYRRSGGASTLSPHPNDSPWLAYTGNAFTGEHSWLEDGVRCVVWTPEEEPCASSAFATSLVLSGTLPQGLHSDACRCFGNYRRRDERGDGCQLVNGRHTYVKMDDPGMGMMLWFARWPDDATADQYTGWYVGNRSDLGHCRGFLMAPSKDVALRPWRMPTRWAVGRAGPGSGYEPAPGVTCTVPGRSSPGTVTAGPFGTGGASSNAAAAAAGGRGSGAVGPRTRSGGSGGSSSGSAPAAVGSKRKR